MTLPIYQLLYVSEHENRVSGRGYSEAVYDIGLEATARNQQLDITGYLICTPRWFAQVMEGKQQAVDDLFTTIAADPRHHSVCRLFTRHSAVRLFPNWSMGLQTFNPANRRIFAAHGLQPNEVPGDDKAGNLIELARSLSQQVS